MLHKIYLHIGFGKTGSSSLQSYLSFNSVHQNKKEKILYCCLDRNGNVLHGDLLLQQAKNTPLKYVASTNDVTAIPNLNRTKEQISQLIDEGFTPFFSQEDWGRRGFEFTNIDFLNKIGCKAHVIVYVRPQVPWFNSGWWQWYAWGEDFSNPEDVIRAWGYPFMFWGKQVARWTKVPGVERVTVRLHSKDIVKDCMNILGVFSLGEQLNRANVSLSPMLIKVLRQFPELRTQHAADVDFILASTMHFTGKSPWVINKSLVQDIIDNTCKDNLVLMKYLDKDAQEMMQKDNQWWDTSAYSTRKVWTNEELLLKPKECAELLEQALSKISEDDEKLNNKMIPHSKNCFELLGKAMFELIAKGRQIEKAGSSLLNNRAQG